MARCAPSDAETRIARLCDQLSERDSQLARLRDEVSDLEAALAESKEQVAELERSGHHRDQALAGLGKQLAEAMSENGSGASPTARPEQQAGLTGAA